MLELHVTVMIDFFFTRFHHPRFGFIKCIRTIKSVSCGDELTVAYGYDHTRLETDAPEWYKNKLKVWEVKCKERTGSIC